MTAIVTNSRMGQWGIAVAQKSWRKGIKRYERRAVDIYEDELNSRLNTAESVTDRTFDRFLLKYQK